MYPTRIAIRPTSSPVRIATSAYKVQPAKAATGAVERCPAESRDRRFLLPALNALRANFTHHVALCMIVGLGDMLLAGQALRTRSRCGQRLGVIEL
jgi:hypothetical protein